jgi:hypothetical protein
LERRARVQVPKWWAEVLLNSEANERYNVYGWPATDPVYDWMELSDIRAPLGTTLKRDGNKIVLQTQEGSVAVPKELFDAGGWKQNVSALITPARCYVAVHSDWGDPFELTAIERASAKVLWKASVWGYSWAVIASGQNFMCVELVEQDNRVVVFGAGGGFHVEAFQSDTGESLFRFSNSY